MYKICIVHHMSGYNIIHIGDHCAISEILQELQLRKKSYPFDWITCVKQMQETNIIMNCNIIRQLMKTGDTLEATNTLLGDLNGDIFNKIHNKIWFPHEKGTVAEIRSKYERRFTRLYNDIQNEENMFVLLTRNKYIEPVLFDEIIDTLLPHNKRNKILFISGCNHEYLLTDQYNDRVIFKHIPYDVYKFWRYDFTDFRPTVREYMRSVLL